MPKTTVTQNYAVLLRCPCGDEDTWVVLEKRDETLEQILKTPLDFECSVHGVQRQLPLEANLKGPPLASKSKWPTSSKPLPQAVQRSSRRLSLRVPVMAYGWINSQGSFHEDTTTVVVNASGALLTLWAKVEVGDTLFLVNKATHAEQECRVAYVQRDPAGAPQVGLAFLRKAPGFWRVNRNQMRVAKTVRVWVRGVDPNGNPFVQSAQTVDISRKGARLNGVGNLTRPGEVIELKRGWSKARFRVVWIGQIGTRQADEIGILCLDDDQSLWDVPAPPKPPTP
jgi:hypothetical protein